MSSRRYTLDARAAAKVRRLIASAPIPHSLRVNEPKKTVLTMVKIEAHEGLGVYKAIEVFWSGSAWSSDTNLSRKFGTAYGTSGVRHIAADTSVAVNTIVRAFAFPINSATGLSDWFFQEGGGGAYTGPFAAAWNAGTSKLDIGGTRDASNLDYIIVHPDVLTYSAVQSIALGGTGYVYIGVTREGTIAATTPTWAAVVPANTAQVIQVPICSVVLSGSSYTVRQMQYGNIILDKTVSDYCP